MASPRKGIPPTELTSKREALATIVSAETGTVIDAILVGGKGWKRRGKQAPIYGDEHGTFVSLGHPGASLSTGDEERAWARVLEYDDMTATSLLFVMARYLAVNDDPKSPKDATIHVNELLEYRGFGRHRKRDFRPEYKIAERDRILSLARIWVTVPIPSRKGSKRPATQSSQLIHTSVESEGPEPQNTLPNLDVPGTSVPYSFTITLGKWASAYVEKQEARLILANIMAYDPKKSEERIAMRLGLHLHFRPAQIVTIREILEGARIETPTDHLVRFRDSVENALHLLADDKIIGGWAYLDGEPSLPRYKWIEDWLGLQIAIKPSSFALKTAATATDPQRALT